MMGIVAPATDLYAWAMTFLVLLTAKSPQQLYDPLQGEVDFRDIPASEELARLLQKCLEIHVKDRVQSAEQAREWLLRTPEARGHLGQTASYSEPAPAEVPHEPLPSAASLPAVSEAIDERSEDAGLPEDATIEQAIAPELLALSQPQPAPSPASTHPSRRPGHRWVRALGVVAAMGVCVLVGLWWLGLGRQPTASDTAPRSGPTPSDTAPRPRPTVTHSPEPRPSLHSPTTPAGPRDAGQTTQKPGLPSAAPRPPTQAKRPSPGKPPNPVKRTQLAAPSAKGQPAWWPLAHAAPNAAACLDLKGFTLSPKERDLLGAFSPSHTQRAFRSFGALLQWDRKSAQHMLPAIACMQRFAIRSKRRFLLRLLGHFGKERPYRVYLETIYRQIPLYRRTNHGLAKAMASLGSFALPFLTEKLGYFSRNPQVTVGSSGQGALHQLQSTIEALGQLGVQARHLAPQLLVYLDHSHWPLLYATLMALRKMKANQTSVQTKALALVMRKKGGSHQRLAMDLLRQSRSLPRGCESLVKIYEGLTARYTRAKFLDLLGRCRHPQSLRIIEGVLQGKPSYALSQAALAAGYLGSYGKTLLPRLRQLLTSVRWVRKNARVSIARIAPSSIGPWVRKKLKGKRPEQRHVFYLFKTLGPEAGPAMPALLDALKDPKRYIYPMLLKQMGKLGPDVLKGGGVSLPQLAGLLLKQVQGSTHSGQRSQAAWTLGRLGPPARFAAGPLYRVFRDPKTRGQRLKAQLLAAVLKLQPRHPQAHAFLRKALRSTNPSLRRLAEKVLSLR